MALLLAVQRHELHAAGAPHLGFHALLKPLLPCNEMVGGGVFFAHGIMVFMGPLERGYPPSQNRLLPLAAGGRSFVGRLHRPC